MLAYYYIDRITNILLGFVNLIIRIVSSFRPRLKRTIRRNKTISNLKDSDECYIIGNGPSLRTIDLDRLRDRDTFCVNFFYKHPKDDFESKFFLAIDDGFLQGENKEYILNTYKNHPQMKMFLRYDISKTPEIEWDKDRAFFLYSKQFQYGDNVKYDCTKVMTSCINVVLQCIQVAIYMGYKRIYLLGCDFNQYTQLKPEHFYGVDSGRNENNMGSDARWSSMVHYHHYALQKLAKKKGIEIVNLTEGSLIDAYPRAKYEDVVKG